MMNTATGFLWGVLGGILPEIYALYKIRQTYHKKLKKNDWVNSKFYWFITTVMVLIGGGTVCLYLHIGVNVNELMAVHLGVATPILISSAMRQKPKVN